MAIGFFTRVRDRPAAIQPISIGVKPAQPIKKREREDYHDKLDWSEEEVGVSSGDPPMDPFRTTKKRVEKKEFSTLEKKYRTENLPCIEEMLKIRLIMLQQRAAEEKRLKEKERRRQLLLEQMNKLSEAIKNGNVEGVELEMGEDQNVEMPLDMDDDAENAEFQRMALYLKEQRITRQMQSFLMHIPLTRYKRFKFAIDAAYFGGRRYEPFTQVLPWLYLGRGSVAKEQRFLQALGFTHVMNCTKEVSPFALSPILTHSLFPSPPSPSLSQPPSISTPAPFFRSRITTLPSSSISASP
jgi:hypothetical protein